MTIFQSTLLRPPDEPLLTAVAVTIRAHLLALDTYVLRKAAIVRALVWIVQKVGVAMVVNAVSK